MFSQQNLGFLSWRWKACTLKKELVTQDGTLEYYWWKYHVCLIEIDPSKTQLRSGANKKKCANPLTAVRIPGCIMCEFSLFVWESPWIFLCIIYCFILMIPVHRLILYREAVCSALPPTCCNITLVMLGIYFSFIYSFISIIFHAFIFLMIIELLLYLVPGQNQQDPRSYITLLVNPNQLCVNKSLLVVQHEINNLLAFSCVFVSSGFSPFTNCD